MTVETQVNRVRYLGNGLTTQFPIPFPVLQPGHLRLFLWWPDERQTEITAFTVLGAGTPAVTAALDAAPLAGTLLTILRQMPLTQPMDLMNGGPFNAETLEGSADNLAMQIQQLAEALERAVVMPEGLPDDERTNYQRLLDLRKAAEAARDEAREKADRAEAWAGAAAEAKDQAQTARAGAETARNAAQASQAAAASSASAAASSAALAKNSELAALAAKDVLQDYAGTEINARWTPWGVAITACRSARSSVIQAMRIYKLQSLQT